MHDSVVETTSMTLSRSIREIDADTCSAYIPNRAMSILLKKRGSVLALRLLITPLPWPCAFASSEAK